MTGRLAFDLPTELEASAPPEARGLRRDGVRMMVVERATGAIHDSSFVALPTFLDPGDVVVINTSGTLPAALTGIGEDGTVLQIHLSTWLKGNLWVVEPRALDGASNVRWNSVVDRPPPPNIVLGEDGALLQLLAPYRDSDRLWIARLELPKASLTWLAVNGKPIRYSHVPVPWPLSAYQNVYVTEPGSAEMPSAGRPFTPELITRLVSKGIEVVPIVLHTGVASLESNEIPYPERVKVAPPTARAVNAARHDGSHVIAIGSTAVRALESAFDPEIGELIAIDGWTELVVSPDRGLQVADGMLTGWHEPGASHLMMLQTLMGRDLLESSYDKGLEEGYLWHEFGDVQLVLP